MCARREAIEERQSAAECLTKACQSRFDIDAALRDWWETLLEPTPADMLHMLSEQK